MCSFTDAPILLWVIRNACQVKVVFGDVLRVPKLADAIKSPLM